MPEKSISFNGVILFSFLFPATRLLIKHLSILGMYWSNQYFNRPLSAYFNNLKYQFNQPIFKCLIFIFYPDKPVVYCRLILVSFLESKRKENNITQRIRCRQSTFPPIRFRVIIDPSLYVNALLSQRMLLLLPNLTLFLFLEISYVQYPHQNGVIFKYVFRSFLVVAVQKLRILAQRIS